jgi:hypothetical protein
MLLRRARYRIRLANNISQSQKGFFVNLPALPNHAVCSFRWLFLFHPRYMLGSRWNTEKYHKITCFQLLSASPSPWIQYSLSSCMLSLLNAHHTYIIIHGAINSPPATMGHKMSILPPEKKLPHKQQQADET